ncbi:MAG: beta-propeller domain-containing protein [Azoarcus sp.]|nr:beta-propeller domain-containing protein [Azoarcus sp.]
MSCLSAFLGRSLSLLLLACLLGVAVEAPAAPKTLRPFASEKELNDWVERKKAAYEEWQKEEQAKRQNRRKISATIDLDSVQESVAIPDSPPLAAAVAATAASAAPAAESVTNTQTAGVDEGGIVKAHGDHLVILRRGRLFTVRIGGGDLAPVDKIDAFAPGSSGRAWYDEMLISGNTVVVIGYSYAKGGSEINLFDIDAKGRLTYRSTYVLRSNDYYSSRNYASRLIGDKLIFYTPLYLNFRGDPFIGFPAIRSWTPKEENVEFKRLAPATRIYRAADDLDHRGGIALHTIETCKIGDGRLDCSAMAVLGPAGREFYVAKDAVYVWSAPLRRFSAAGELPVSASVFRLPLDVGKAPTALKTWGSPIDQFSFLESADGYLNVLLRAEGPIASMWASEKGSQNLAFLRVPLAAFGDGTTSAPNDAYHPLPAVPFGSLQNRYVGDYLVYGGGQTWWRSEGIQRNLGAGILDWKRPESARKFDLPHSVDRIEALGKAPLIVGGEEKNLHFSALDVSGGDALQVKVAGSFVLPDAAQGETRSHGFFYKPDADAKDGTSGLLGLPFVGGGTSGWRQLMSASNGVVFLRNERLQLTKLGALTATVGSTADDDCKASCVDWYGNSRPLFVAGRVFALMGYEIVEGKIAADKIAETRRIEFLQSQNVWNRLKGK